MFIAALLTLAKTWQQPKCLSTDKWIKKMWCVYIYIYIHTHTHIYTQWMYIYFSSYFSYSVVFDSVTS